MLRPPDTQRPALLLLGQLQGCAGARAVSGGLCCSQRTRGKQLSLASTDQAKRVSVPFTKNCLDIRGRLLC